MLITQKTQKTQETQSVFLNTSLASLASLASFAFILILIAEAKAVAFELITPAIGAPKIALCASEISPLCSDIA